MKTIEWAAGLFEGEGCIHTGVDKRNGNFRHSLHLGGKDKDVIEAFHSVMGTGKFYLRGAKQKEEHSDIYIWQVYAREKVRQCLELLLPYLGERRAYKAQNSLDDIDNYFYLKQNHGNLV